MLLKQRMTTEVMTGDQVSGYVYAYTGPDGVRVQEWVLFENFVYANEAPMTLRAVTQPAWQHEALEGFVAQVERARSEQDWLFARARAVEIKDPREIDGGPPGECLVMRAGDDMVGFVCATGKAPRRPLTEELSSRVVERWFLYDGFEPAPAAALRVGDKIPMPMDPVALVVEATVDYSRYDQAIARLRGAVRAVA